MPKLTSDDYRQAVRKLGLKSKYSYYNKTECMFHCCFGHSDRTPSLNINFELGIYHCFQCGKSGNLYGLVLERANTNIYNLLGITGDIDFMNDPYQNVVEEVKPEKVVTPLDIRGTMVPFYESEAASVYVNRRGISKDTATAMHMKYAKEIYINGTHFVDRLLIPIYDGNKGIINMEGRALNPNDPTKCLYPKNGTKPIYQHYCLDLNNPLYLFEGIIKMAVARSDPFFTNSSASLGSQVSDYQMEQLNNFSSVILVRDMDDAGAKMAKKLKERYKGKFSVWLTVDDKIKDVDEIPTILKVSVKEYRENGGFVADMEYM